MAQVNSVPGQNQTFANAVVASGRSQPGSVDQETKANAVTVAYTQSEPGRKKDTAEGKRA
jgi:hypothetical protein